MAPGGVSRLLGTCRALSSPNHSSAAASSATAGAGSSRSGGISFPCGGGGGGGGDDTKVIKTKEMILLPASCQGKTSRVAAVASPAGTAAVDVISPEKKKQQKESSPGFLVAETASKLLDRKKRWRLQAEMLIERGVIGCQSFTLVAVAGSLLGSILCFLEGCFLVLESFLQYYHTMYQGLDQGGGIIELLIQAIDMFLVGTALLTFGMGLYVMFAGSDASKKSKGWDVDESNQFGLFNLKRLSEEMGMNSLADAKSKVGHAVVMILQAGVLDKFKTVPLTSSLDLACFAAAVFVSSACVFLLSKLGSSVQ